MPAFRVPREGALPPGSLHRAPWRETLHPQSPFIQLSKSPVDEPSSRFPKSRAPTKRCPSQQSFLNVHQGPRQGSPLPGSLHRAPTERDCPSPEPLQLYLKVPVDKPTPGCPKSLHKERFPSPEPSFPNLRGPQQRTPPYRFP